MTGNTHAGRMGPGMLCPLLGSRPRYSSDRDGRTTAKRFDNEELLDPEAEEFGRPLHLGAFGKSKRVLDVDAKITNGALDPIANWQ
jgi:hypothetical protein